MNSINVMALADERKVIIQTIIAGKSEAWITFTAEELDGLITTLQKARESLGEPK